MTERAARLWHQLYVSTFARRRHPTLWEAMASLDERDKYAIDNEAERIIDAWIANGEVASKQGKE